jgi:rSAM/selenodomain-associated transferase 1
MDIAKPDQAAPSCGIAVMAKASVPGHAKTRLVPPLTSAEAAALNTAFLQDVAANILAAARHADIAGYMAFGPPGPDSVAFFQRIVPDVGLLQVWYPSLGDCLASTIDQLLARGHAAAVVLNSDSPTLPTSLLVETANVLAQPGDCAVFGPCTDGGYYLLGLKQRHRRLFEDITWSTEQVARQTLDRAAELGLRVHLLPAWYDVDDAETLRTLQSELCGELVFSASLHPHEAPHSARLLRALLADADLARRLASAGGAAAVRAAE